jgi:hypothetical protein
MEKLDLIILKKTCLLSPSNHWSKSMERVVSVRPLANYMFKFEFQDGLRKVIDIRPFLGKVISAPLKDEACFRKVALEDGGGITWPNGFDFCPISCAMTCQP